MELIYDWNRFEKFFEIKRDPRPQGEEETRAPVAALVEKGRVIAAIGDGEDLRIWIGEPLEAFRQAYEPRGITIYDAEEFFLGAREAAAGAHQLEQAAEFRRRLKPVWSGPKAAQESLSRRALESHFFFELLRGKLSKFFPNQYGVLIRLLPDSVDAQSEDLLILLNQGKITRFFEPDLYSLGKDRRGDLGCVVKYLSEKQFVPVQGIAVPSTSWTAWGASSHPWKLLSRSFRKGEVELSPKRVWAPILLAMRAWM